VNVIKKKPLNSRQKNVNVVKGFSIGWLTISSVVNGETVPMFSSVTELLWIVYVELLCSATNRSFRERFFYFEIDGSTLNPPYN